MARYFELLDDRSHGGRWHLGCPMDEAGRELDPWQFKKGKWLELGHEPRFPIDVPGESLDFCWAAFSIPVVHARFATSLVKRHGQDAQFIPSRVDGHGDSWFILNPLQVIPCIDDARCGEVQRWLPEDGRPEKTGEYRVVAGLRIDPDRVGGAHLFRPWGWRGALVVSEGLKLALEEERMTGMRFVEV
ncbi:imm11 family protein [Melittangium boletus]|uniref:imm11 family protein n=1 Tax=Melittangium boletus TaxID=83453 RepID=UPI003DA605BB